MRSPAVGKRGLYQPKAKHSVEFLAGGPCLHLEGIYDGLRLVAQAMKAANSVEPAKYRAALAGIEMQGVAGRYPFDPNRDLRDSPITIYSYRGGARVPLPQDR